MHNMHVSAVHLESGRQHMDHLSQETVYFDACKLNREG